MNPPFYHDTFFPYVHLSLQKITVDEIDSIPDWIAYFTRSQDYFQIDMDASHPWLSSIISTLITCIINNKYLSYIHIKQLSLQHFLTPALLQELIKVVHTNQYPNITIQVTCNNKIEYY